MRQDAEDRLFLPDQIEQFMSNVDDYEAVMNGVRVGMYGDDNDADDLEGMPDMSIDDIFRLRAAYSCIHTP